MTPQNEKKVRLPSKGLNSDLTEETVNYIISTGACFFSEKRHDSLVRCQECHIKYDMYRLTYTLDKKFVCKYCINKGDKR